MKLDYKANRNAPYYVVVLTNLKSTKNETESELDRIFHCAFRMHMTNFHILIYDWPESTWSILTYLPFKDDCKTLTHHIVETFNMDNYTTTMKMSFDELYPPKLRKLNGCKIRVAAVEVEPYVINYYNGSALDGIDVRIVKGIANAMNFEPEFILVKDRGVVLENGSSTDAMKMVKDWKVNLTIGIYLLTQERIALLSPSVPYLQESIGFTIGESHIPPSPMNWLMASLSFDSWFLIFATFFGSTILVFLTKLLSSQQRHFLIGGKVNRTPVLNMFHIILGGSIDNRRMKHRRYFGTFARTLAMLWILFCFFLRSTYEGALLNFIRSQRLYSNCDTLAKIKNSNCKIVLPDSGVHHLKKFGFDEKQ